MANNEGTHLSKIHPEIKQENLESPKNFSGVFQQRTGYINEFQLYLAFFSFVPNYLLDKGINCQKFKDWFDKKFQTEIVDLIFNMRRFKGKNDLAIDDCFYILKNSIIVYIDTNCDEIKVLFGGFPNETVKSIISELTKFKIKKKNESVVGLLMQTFDGLAMKSLKVSKPNLKIEDNYNDDFLPIHQTILEKLTKSKQKGLVLLHGKPGTGKTSYLRYLISMLKKDVIFLPPNIAHGLTNPELIGTLVEHPNSIFVIEDAENLITDREQDGFSPVSTLLNISDGLLSDFLNIQIICSFNTDLSKIDPALMRKGRLIAKYEFKELTTDKVKKLSQKLGNEINASEPMTLAAIYNFTDQNFYRQPKTGKIGFQLSA